MVSSVLPLAFSAISGGIAAKRQQKAQSAEQDKVARAQMQQERTLKDEENNQKRLRTEQLRALRGRTGARSLIATSDTGLSGLIG